MCTIGTDQSGDADVEVADELTLARAIIEERGGYPGHVTDTERTGDQGVLRVGFHDEEPLTERSWEQFRDAFGEKGLVALYRGDDEAVAVGKPVVLRERAAVDVPRRDAD